MFINRPLWNKIIGIIPYYQKEFRIDGVMIDMGHALPMELKAEMVRAPRGSDHDFAFWDENFSVTQRSREEGYNAVFGFTMFDQHPSRQDEEGSPGGHRTRRLSVPVLRDAGKPQYAPGRSEAGRARLRKWTLAVNAFLPAVPFIHSGFELAEQVPHQHRA